MRETGASPGRGTYSLARTAEEVIYDTRSSLATLFNIADVTRIIFTCNVTESLNLALKGLLNDGDHVITTHMEHNALWRPLKVLEKQKGLNITVLDCPDGQAFNPAELEKLVLPTTELNFISLAIIK